MNEQPGRQISDDELADSLGAADALPTSAPPVAEIVARGRRERRRRAAALVAGAAAAVVAVVGGTALLTGGDDAIAPAEGGDSAVDGSTDGSAEGPVPAAPEGMRWVSKSGVMVAVPADWSTNALRCARTPTEDTVVLDPGARPMCQAPRPAGVSSVDLRNDGESLPAGAEQLGDGLARTTAECDDAGLCTGVVRGEGAGLSIYVESPDAALVDEITGSARPVPDGVTVVPPRKLESLFVGDQGRAGYLRQLRQAGLEVEPEPGLNPNGTFDIEPAPGSVVEEGSVVRLVKPSR